MSTRRTLIGVSLFAIAALLVTYMIYSTLARSVSGDTSKYTTYFSDSAGLRVRDDVRMAGVRVGKVESVELDGNRAKVTFVVQDSQHVCADTRANIKYQNLIGQRYLGLERTQAGACQAIKPGDLKVAPESSFDVAQLLAGFQPLFNTLNPDQLNPLIQTLAKAFEGDQFEIGQTVAYLATVSQNLSQRDPVLRQIIDDVAVTMRAVAQQSDSLKSVIASTSNVIEKLNANSALFGRTIEDVSVITGKLSPLLQDLTPTITDIGAGALRATNSLVQQGPKLDELGVLGNQSLLPLARVTNEGAWMNIYACTIDVSLYGLLLPYKLLTTLTNAIVPGNHSQVCR